MSVSYKAGVKGSPSQGIQHAINVADGIYSSFGHNLVVTSLRDGVHSPTSLHYSGNAVDLRIWGLTGEILNQIVAALRSALGHPGQYEVYPEGDHIHIEYNGPGRGAAPPAPQPTTSSPLPTKGSLPILEKGSLPFLQLGGLAESLGVSPTVLWVGLGVVAVIVLFRR